MKKTMAKDDALEDRMEALCEGKDWAPRFVLFVSCLVLFFFSFYFHLIICFNFHFGGVGRRKGEKCMNLGA